MREALPRLIKQWSDAHNRSFRLLKVPVQNYHNSQFRLEQMDKDLLGNPKWMPRGIENHTNAIIEILVNDR